MNRKYFALLAVGLIAPMLLAACGGGAATPPPLTVAVKAEDIKFDTTTLTAKVGQPVTINLQNAGALEHSFVIDELNVKIEKVQPGQSGTVTFTPQQAGTYTYYCDVPGHKQAGMVGTLTVNP